MYAKCRILLNVNRRRVLFSWRRRYYSGGGVEDCLWRAGNSSRDGDDVVFIKVGNENSSRGGDRDCLAGSTECSGPCCTRSSSLFFTDQVLRQYVLFLFIY